MERKKKSEKKYFQLSRYHPFRQRTTVLWFLCCICLIEAIVGLQCSKMVSNYLNQNSNECQINQQNNDFGTIYSAAKSSASNLMIISAILICISVCGMLAWCHYRREVYMVRCENPAQLKKKFGRKGYTRNVTLIFLGICAVFLVFWWMALMVLIFLDSDDFYNNCSKAFVNNSTFTNSLDMLKGIAYPVIIGVFILLIVFVGLTRCCCLCVSRTTDADGHTFYECNCSNWDGNFCYLFC